MSLHNLATVFGPIVLQASPNDNNGGEILASSTVDFMARSGILYHFLSCCSRIQFKSWKKHFKKEFTTHNFIKTNKEENGKEKVKSRGPHRFILLLKCLYSVSLQMMWVQF